jgi:hypothetical protein
MSTVSRRVSAADAVRNPGVIDVESTIVPVFLTGTGADC